MLRVSRYTFSTDESDGSHLLYNTANGAFAQINDGLWKTCQEPEKLDAHMADELAHDGFLTELSPEQELADIHARFTRHRHDHSELTLSLAPTYSCNLRCPYCYEAKRHELGGRMSEKVMDALITFVDAHHERTGFSRLSVQWYGGEPSLALDAVETLSDKLIEWCREQGVSYKAMILTNATRIDDAAAQMLVARKVTSAFVTIDGIGATNDARRLAADGSSTYESILAGISALAGAGIAVNANMNIDRVNWPEYHELKDLLASKMGVDLGFEQTCDYMHTFGSGAFSSPTFELFTQDEFSELSHDEFMAQNPDSSMMRALLTPHSTFCNGQRDDYFIVDYRGDVYLCDERIGEPGRAAFNVDDNTIPPECLELISHDPLDDAECAACHLLPICQGNCIWERTLLTSHCHPFLTTLPDYLRDYRACCKDVEFEEGYALLAAPFTEEELAAL
jgi:uncharacterized protein